MPDDLKKYIVSALRMAFHKSGLRGQALRLAKVGPGLYECAKCKNHFTISEVDVDHRIPVVDIEKGWQGFNEFIKRLFTEKLAVLCKQCHKRKTAWENSKRWKGKRK